MTEAQAKQIVAIIHKLSIFRGLVLEEVKRLLQILHVRRYDAEQKVYKKGDPADEMFILVQGTLSVVSPAGTELSEITSGMSIGEMGLFTGQPRSADIQAKTPALGFAIRKIELDALLKLNKDTQVKVLKNVIGHLADRLRDANDKLDRSGDTIERLQDKIEELVG